MEYVSATFGRRIRLRLDDNGDSEEGCFAEVACSSIDPTMQAVFLDAVQFIGETFPGDTTHDELSPVLESLYEVFRAMGSAARTTALGAWGEVLVIHESPNPNLMVDAWHDHPEDLVDFAAGNHWLEVKTTTRPERRHQVGQRQVSPADHVQGHLCSIKTSVGSEGVSLRELARRVMHLLGSHAEAKLKFQSVLARQLGRDYSSAMSATFDLEQARKSLRLFDMRAIPALQQPPPEITGISYEVSLDQAPRADVECDDALGFDN